MSSPDAVGLTARHGSDHFGYALGSRVLRTREQVVARPERIDIPEVGIGPSHREVGGGREATEVVGTRRVEECVRTSTALKLGSNERKSSTQCWPVARVEVCWRAKEVEDLAD